VALLSDSEKTKILKTMGLFIAHTAELGVRIERVEGEKLTLRLPYQEKLIGDPEAGTLHGGALTVLLDQTLGMSAICCDSAEPSVAPTLDLRIDHLGVAPAGKDIFATAWVYKSTRKVLFMEGFAYCESPDKPIARATGTWVRLADVDLSLFLDDTAREKKQ
jgi:uncharacterized protein (TIGR00369 family)